MLGPCSAKVPRVFLWPRCTWNPTFSNFFSPVTQSQKRRDNNGLAPQRLEDDVAHDCPSFAANLSTESKSKIFPCFCNDLLSIEWVSLRGAVPSYPSRGAEMNS